MLKDYSHNCCMLNLMYLLYILNVSHHHGCNGSVTKSIQAFVCLLKLCTEGGRLKALFMNSRRNVVGLASFA
jgi:hypothetical protein